MDVPYSHGEILKEVRKRDSDLSFVDMVLLKVSKKLGARILTFDRELEEYGIS